MSLRVILKLRNPNLINRWSVLATLSICLNCFLAITYTIQSIPLHPTSESDAKGDNRLDQTAKTPLQSTQEEKRELSSDPPPPPGFATIPKSIASGFLTTNANEISLPLIEYYNLSDHEVVKINGVLSEFESKIRTLEKSHAYFEKTNDGSNSLIIPRAGEDLKALKAELSTSITSLSSDKKFFEIGQILSTASLFTERERTRRISLFVSNEANRLEENLFISIERENLDGSWGGEYRTIYESNDSFVEQLDASLSHLTSITTTVQTVLSGLKTSPYPIGQQKGVPARSAPPVWPK